MGIRDILLGRRPSFVTTPPFMPGGYPGVDLEPGRPGMLDFLRDGIMTAAQPNIAGGGALDTLRAISAGIGLDGNRRQSEAQQRLAAMEMSRRMQNDGILAQARMADAERDRARAALDLANANKKPPTLQQKFEEALAIVGDRDKAMMWALNGKIPEQGSAPLTIALDPNIAKGVGLAVPMKTSQVPTTEPETDTRYIEHPTGEPFRVPPSVATAAIQTWSRANQQPPRKAASAPPRADLRETAEGWMYFRPEADGTVTKMPVGERSPDRRRSSGRSGGGITSSRANGIEASKQTQFRRIQDDIRGDPSLEDNADTHIQRALDAQRGYEEQIVAAGGSVSEEDSARNAEMIRNAFANRIQQTISSRNQKTPPQKKETGGGWFGGWGSSSPQNPASQPVVGEYIPGRGLVRR
jgi:hypothetical protein